MSQISLMLMLVLTWALSGAGQAPDRAAYVDIEARPLADALKRVAEVFDLEIAFFPEDVRDIEAPSLAGRYTADEALSRLLEDTPLVHRFVDEDSVAIVPKVDRPAVRDEVHRPLLEHFDQHASGERVGPVRLNDSSSFRGLEGGLAVQVTQPVDLAAGTNKPMFTAGLRAAPDETLRNDSGADRRRSPARSCAAARREDSARAHPQGGKP